MKRYLLLALTTLPVLAAFGCKKTVPTVEAGADTDAAVATPETAAPVVDTDAGPAATLAVTNKPPVPVAPKDAGPPPPGPFAGSYSCFGGISLQHQGTTVGGRLKPADNQNFSTITCTVSGDTCDGTAQIFTGGKPSGSKHFSLKRNPANGDLVYKEDGSAPTACHKK